MSVEKTFTRVDEAKNVCLYPPCEKGVKYYVRMYTLIKYLIYCTELATRDLQVIDSYSMNNYPQFRKVLQTTKRFTPDRYSFYWTINFTNFFGEKTLDVVVY